MNDAYTAGIIDGEGTITIANQDGYYYLRVNVTMSDKGYRVLDFLHREYGGMMGKERPSSGNTRASKQWRVSNGDAARVINSVLRYLRLKREQALVALQLWDLIEEAPKKSNGRTEWSDSMRASAEVLKRRMGELNARGVRGPEPQEIHEGAVAVWKYGEWHEPEDDLFGPVPFGGKLPVSGSMRNGVVYELPMSAHRTEGSGFLSSQPGALFPTPAAPVANDGESTETWLARRELVKLTAANGNGMGMPLTIAVQLLKTPTAQLAVNGGSQHPDKRRAGGHGPTLADEVEHLLPTPKAGDADFGMPRTSGRPPEKSTHLMTRLMFTLPVGPDLCNACGHDDLVHDADGFCAECSPHDCRDLVEVPMLPTPRATRGGSQHPGKRKAGGHGPTLADEVEHLLPTPRALDATGVRGRTPNRSDVANARAGVTLTDATSHQPDTWGQYSAAIERWEAILGVPAPEPTELGPKGGRRLSAAFVEWMMGVPAGWVTDPDLSLTRSQQLRALGNGVVPGQALEALRRASW